MDKSPKKNGGMHTCPAVPALRRLIFRGVRRLFALPQGITQGKRQQRKSGERRQKDDPRADQGIWRPILRRDGNPRNFGVGSMGTETCSRTGTSMTETRS